MAADVPLVKEKVQGILVDVAPVTIDRDGDFGLKQGSTQVFVRVAPHPNGEVTLVRVFAPVLVRVTPTPEFYKWVALHTSDWVFGHLRVYEGEEGQVSVYLEHSLLGDFLDRDELLYATLGILSAADEADDEMQQLFGGQKWGDL